MPIIDDSSLESMLSDLESDIVERKETFRGDSPDKVRQAVCAFANDLPDHKRPGVIFIGARDDGAPASLPITDDLLLALADIKSDGNILPLPSLTVEKRHLKGVDMAVIIVSPSDAPPVRYKGRIWVRTGPRRDIASAQDERILNEKRRYRDLPFDIHPLPYANIEDFSRRLFEDEYLPSIVARDVIERNSRSYEQQLAACRMIETADHPVPTVLGIMVLSPRARDFIANDYIQFLRIDGEELSDPIVDEEAIDGALAQMLRRADDKLEAHIRTRVDISENLERRRPDYPLVALQQMLRNAVMHRTYEATNAPVRVTWFNDRIEIANPGGPYGLVTRDNFGQPGRADYRNPNLAEAMKALGFVQRFGVGIATARKALADNGNPPPVFDVEPNLILVTLRKQA